MIADPASVGFSDRRHAGMQLADRLLHYGDRDDVLVLALPRGGVPVAFEVAKKLRVPLDVFLVRKLGVPGHEELALGAVASGGVCVMNNDVINLARISDAAIESVKADELRELRRREQAYRGSAAAPQVAGRTVIVIDDGLATGASMRAAVQALRLQGPARLVVAAPVSTREACQELQAEVDETICGIMPEPFYGVGAWYGDYAQTTDEEVRDLLAEAQEWSKTSQGETEAAGQTVRSAT